MSAGDGWAAAASSIQAMPAFVLLALAFAVVALGAVIVAARQVWVGTRRLRVITQRTQERLQPVLDDLQAEVAVSATEAEAVQERVAALQASRRRRDRRPSRGQGGTEPKAGAVD